MTVHHHRQSRSNRHAEVRDNRPNPRWESRGRLLSTVTGCQGPGAAVAAELSGKSS